MGLRQAGTPAGVGAGGVGAEQAWAETRAEGKSFVSLHPPLPWAHPLASMAGSHWSGEHGDRGFPTQTRMAANGSESQQGSGPEHHSTRRGHCECQHS